jgi:hypothetical protein
VTTDLLAKIDARIAAAEADLARYRAFRVTLLELLGLAAADPATAGAAAEELAPAPAASPPGKPQPRPAAPGSGKAGDLVTRVAKLLAEKGPLRAKEMGAALGCQPCKASTVLTANPTLFRKQRGNLFSPWELTEAGRTAAGTA